jgi:outer membrane biosynthesis protein TonB
MDDGLAWPSFVSPVGVDASIEYSTDRSGAVYSRTDPDVVPPQSVYPKLPADRPGVSADGRTVLDLLISADGQVERVRMRTSPRDVHEYMLVSAAKAWRFDPATLDGRPVRFLYTVAIPSQELTH